MRNLSIAATSILLAYSSSLALAQQNPIGGLVGGLINAAKQGAAKEEWEKVAPIKQTCFNATLRSNNLSVQSLIQNGIGPSDPRLNQANAACDEMINRKFRTDYECTFNINNRSIVTWCDEAYAVPNGNGGARRLTVEEAINASASGQQLSMGQFEKPDAERRRLQMIQQNPSATNVPKPTWSCEKAKKPHEVTICNSYELTTIDNQYAQYWAMIKPIDKKRDFQKKADGFYKATLACNSNEVCIKQSLIVAIDNAAEFLKANGTQVSTYTEQQAAKQKADEERQRIQAEQQRRIAEQQERDRQRQREDEERRLAIAKAEAEKAKAEATIRQAELLKLQQDRSAQLSQNRSDAPQDSWPNNDFADCYATAFKASDNNSRSITEGFDLVKNVKIKNGYITKDEFDSILQAANNKIPAGAVAAPGKTPAWYKQCLDNLSTYIRNSPKMTPASGTSASQNAATQWAEGIKYTNYNKGSCTNKSDTHCISDADYERACKDAKGVTQSSLKMLAITASDPQKTLLENQMLDSSDIVWSNNRCHVSLSLAGLVDGTSRRVTASGRGTQFILVNGKLLVYYIDSFQ